MDKRFKSNVDRSFVHYMVDTYGTSRSVCNKESSKQGDIYLEVGLEALKRVSKSTIWNWGDGSSIVFWSWPKDIMN